MLSSRQKTHLRLIRAYPITYLFLIKHKTLFSGVARSKQWLSSQIRYEPLFSRIYDASHSLFATNMMNIGEGLIGYTNNMYNTTKRKVVNEWQLYFP